MFVNVASESGGSKLPSSRSYHSVEMNILSVGILSVGILSIGILSCTQINTLINATRRLKFAIEIKIQYLFI